MSKERLEKIEEIDEEVSNGFALEDLDLNTMTVVNRQHFEWLKEQAKQNKRYREAYMVLEQIYKDNFVRNSYGYEDGFLDGIDTAIDVIDEALERESDE